MVYESDFYTTRRPYRPSPGYSTYTVTSAPSRQIRVLPGLGKVHIVHTYDRIVPYVGHKRLTVVTVPPRIYATRPTVLQREYDWIESRLRPWVGYSAVNRYLNSDPAMLWDSEARLIRAQTASLLKQVHLNIPRVRSWPITALNRYGEVYSLPVKYSNDTYIHRLLTVSPNKKIEYSTYYTEPVKKYFGSSSHLACVKYAGNKSYDRRRPLALYEDTLRNDINLLSYYITRFRQEKIQPKEVPLSSSRPSRIFSVQKPLEDPVVQELKDLKEARAARLAKIYDSDTSEVESSLKAKQKKEEVLLAEERAAAEEQEKKKAQAKKEEAARKAEKARQEQLAAQAAAEQAAELERQAEKARQEELAKQAELERLRQLEEETRLQEEQQRQEEERLRLEELKRLEEEEEKLRLAEEERKRQEEEEEKKRQEEEEKKRLEEEEKRRLEEEANELARQAEEEKERELARQAEELAEIARQEAELAELERQEKELAEQAEAAEAAPEEAEPVVEESPEEAAPEEEPEAEPVVEEVVESEQEPEVSSEPTELDE